MNPFKLFKKKDYFLYFSFLVIITVAFLSVKEKDYLTLVSSLVGVTALSFMAKGHVMGQIVTVVFSVFYGIVSFLFKYYGEMITYLFMTAPMAVMAIISWAKNPFKESNQVSVRKLKKRDVYLMFILGIIVTIIFYFVLKWLNNANIIVSTLSIFTSFIACFLTFLRSPYYAVGYALNDIVLIVLWALALKDSFSYFPLVVNFTLFFIYDLYAFIVWKKMEIKQKNEIEKPV